MSSGIVASYFLDVGQGDCSFILGPSKRQVVMMDCADPYVAQRFVADHKIDHLKAVVASHLDSDHIAGMGEFMSGFISSGKKIERFFICIDKLNRLEDENDASALLEQAAEWHAEKVLKVCRAERDDVGAITVCSGPGWSVEIVLPIYGDHLADIVFGRDKANPASVVLRISRGNSTLLIGGDAPLCCWERLKEEDPTKLVAKVIRTPHHGGVLTEGSTTWTEKKLYKEIKPKVAVFSVGTNNGYKHPREKHMAAVDEGSKGCRRLCTQLTKRCHPKPGDVRAMALELQSNRVEPMIYRHRTDGKEVPCAGTIVAELRGDKGQLHMEPPSKWHDEFVDEVVENPMCSDS